MVEACNVLRVAWGSVLRIAYCVVGMLVCAVSLFAEPKVESSMSQQPKIKALEISTGDSSAGQRLVLRSSDARQQILVTATIDDGSLRDCTRSVKFEVKPANVVKVDASGYEIGRAHV